MRYETVPLQLRMHTNYGDHPLSELNLHEPFVVLPSVSVPYNYDTGIQAAQAQEVLGRSKYNHCS